MIIPKIQEYAKQQLKLGKTETEILTNLKSVGWNELDITDSTKPIFSKGIKPQKEKKKGSRVAVVLLLIVLFLGIGTVGAGYYVTTQPAYVFNKSYKASENLKTAKFTAKMIQKVDGLPGNINPLSTTPSSTQSIEYTVYYTGQIDTTVNTSPEVLVNMKTNLSDIVKAVTDDADTIKGAGEFELSYIYKLNKSYIKVNQLNDISGVSFETILDRWIDLDLSFEKEIKEGLDRQPEAPVSPIDQFLFLQEIEKTGFVKFKQTKQQSLTKVAPSHVFSYEMDMSKYQEFYKVVQKYDKSIPEQSEKEIKDINEMIKMFDGPVTGEIYIDNVTSYINGMTMNMQTKTEDRGSLITTSFEVIVYDQNKATDIKVPSETVSMEKVMEDFMTSNFGSYNMPTTPTTKIDGDKQRQTDLSFLKQGLTQYLEKNGSNSLLLFNCSDSAQLIGTAPGSMDLQALLVPEFLNVLPKDPDVGTTENTGYSICLTDDKKIRLEAPNSFSETPVNVVFDFPAK